MVDVIKKDYYKVSSSIRPVSDTILINNINPSLTTNQVALRWYNSASGGIEVVPTGGLVKVEYQKESNQQWFEDTLSPLVASDVKNTPVFRDYAKAVRVTPSDITGATHYQVVLVSSNDSVIDQPLVESGTALVDTEYKTNFNTIFGETQVGFKIDDISCQFQYNISGRDANTATSGTGSISTTDSIAIVHTGTGVGNAYISSKDSVRYRPGHECVAMFTSAFSPGEPNTKMYQGLVNDDNGFAVGYKEDQFGFFFIDNGVETFIPQADWDEDTLDGTGKSGYTLKPENYNIYKISFGWLGIAPIYLSVYGGYKKGWILAHVIDLTGQQAKPTIGNPSLPLRAYVERTSGTGSDLTIKTSSWRAGVVAGLADEKSSYNRVFSADILEKSVGNTEVPILSFRSKGTYQGKANHVKSEIIVVRFSSDGNKPVIIRGYKNASLTGASFTDANTADSVMQVDTSATSFSGGDVIASTTLGKVDSYRASTINTGLVIYPGESLTVTAVTGTGGTNSISAAIRWVEYF